MTNYKELLQEAATLLDTFQPNEQCMETFTENASKSLEKKYDTEDKSFLLDLMSGCIEQKKVLDVVVNTFYDHHGKLVLKADHNRFSVICYIAVFLLEDIGLQRFSKIIKSQDISKMHKFLSFLFSMYNLTTWIQSEWSQIYDAAYVEQNWILPLLRWRPKVDELLDQLSRRISSGSVLKKTPANHTRPKEFALTKPKPRPLPVPEPIPTQQTHQPVKPSIFKPPKEQQILEELRQKNRQKAQRVLYEANMQQFKCAKPQKSERTEKVISQIKEAQEAQLKFDAVFTSGTPATHKVNSLPIRLNTTTILREGALYNKQLEEELHRLECVVEGGSEPSGFLRWQQQMRERGEQEQLASLEQRRLQGLISHQEAALARTRITQRNLQRAQLKKEETAELMRQYAAKRLQEEEGMRELVQQVADGHKNSKVAKAKLHDFKQSVVREVCEQSRDLLARALEEAQEEMSRKLELIRQIRAIESVPRTQHKLLDDTEMAGHALLCEMSLAELRERLGVLRVAEQRHLEERRRHVQQEKQSREQLLLDQLDNIATCRTAMEEVAARRQAERMCRPSVREQLQEDEKLQALRHTLQEKQQQRHQLTHTLTHTHKLTHTQQTHKHSHTHRLKQWDQRKQKALEEQQWEELEKSLQMTVQQGAPNTR
ncbi:cilia- and flagella-associated protein 99 isoform X3 [Alosa sapidissima]|uniref:cilia- and flagella-associated protein 99 isoform X3 n=1 Tax=Alosa sapidissima TaxID=34773 RepID=UPI001C08F97D|nr:cilia- and flagella-associated protein 99 isoform X3 [Alosa sapidissima]